MHRTLSGPARRRTASASLLAVMSALALSSCGGNGSDGSAGSTSTSTAVTTSSTTSVAPTTTASSTSGGSNPIGSGGIDLGASSSKSYPASMLSQDLAKDCYLGGDRIYDRYGITCSGAQKVLTAYEASPNSAKGTNMTIEGYTCSHNPSIMVIQGGPPGKCLDASGNEVFAWRYPGAPQPDK